MQMTFWIRLSIFLQANCRYCWQAAVYARQGRQLVRLTPSMTKAISARGIDKRRRSSLSRLRPSSARPRAPSTIPGQCLLYSRCPSLPHLTDCCLVSRQACKTLPRSAWADSLRTFLLISHSTNDVLRSMLLVAWSWSSFFTAAGTHGKFLVKQMQIPFGNRLHCQQHCLGLAGDAHSM